MATGVPWFGVYMVALNWGEQHVDAGTAAMVVSIGPILIALLSGWLLGEGLPRPLILGIMVSFAGVILVGIATSTGSHPSLAGVLLCLLAAVSYAVAVVSQRARHARLESSSDPGNNHATPPATQPSPHGHQLTIS
jgi:drug/metabolite transporter (DMT)-like permease